MGRGKWEGGGIEDVHFIYVRLCYLIFDQLNFFLSNELY